MDVQQRATWCILGLVILAALWVGFGQQCWRVEPVIVPAVSEPAPVPGLPLADENYQPREEEPILDAIVAFINWCMGWFSQRA